MNDHVPETSETPAEITPPPADTWFQRLTSVLFIIFCFELGLFLLIYPWTDGWSDNYFAWAIPGRFLQPWHGFWDTGYVRGGLSALGLINLWIALTELFHMFARRHQSNR